MANQERIKLWVDALRSGEFGQCRGGLRKDDNEYCCLGVACEVYRRETGDGLWTGAAFELEAEANNQILPEAVTEWYGLDSRNPRLPIIKVERDDIASSLNDAWEMSFGEIADRIELQYLAEEPSSVL